MTGAQKRRMSTFLSTLSLRRATIQSICVYPGAHCISIHALLAESDLFFQNHIFFHNHFYPRSPCGERLGSVEVGLPILKFLSTLSLRRATSGSMITFSRRSNFYPRSPCGERPPTFEQQVVLPDISIHALLAESDAAWPIGSIYMSVFLSTLSLRRAT